MEEKAQELFVKYLKSYSLMSENAAKKWVFPEFEGRVEELSKISGTELRIRELEELKINV